MQLDEEEEEEKIPKKLTSELLTKSDSSLQTFSPEIPGAISREKGRREAGKKRKRRKTPGAPFSARVLPNN
ncbi:hypothetical protein TNCT_167401 [Trichonephila clavata]|uniref:Uncharacterized protein n=1 Tax=Trichonephila clavata TaxID=2740835 RepID=A0A8X6GZ04_TRICU|nr:hypothetical protein TNCT_167401 [Trichonephila clavata]